MAKSTFAKESPKKKNAKFTEPNYFRPIAVTPIAARIMDRIALEYLEDAMSKSQDIFQFAYKCGYDTIDALLCTIDFIGSQIDNPSGCVIKGLFWTTQAHSTQSFKTSC